MKISDSFQFQALKQVLDYKTELQPRCNVILGEEKKKKVQVRAKKKQN